MKYDILPNLENSHLQWWLCLKIKPLKMFQSNSKFRDSFYYEEGTPTSWLSDIVGFFTAWKWGPENLVF